MNVFISHSLEDKELLKKISKSAILLTIAVCPLFLKSDKSVFACFEIVNLYIYNSAMNLSMSSITIP